jgi:large subunit ribosomal protein L15
MQLHDLKPARGAHRRPERVGRGTGSGRGKTSGRGQKGQNARSQGFRLGFEGGQMPFSQRVPKLPGFKNPFKKVYALVNVSKLSRFTDGSKVDAEALLAAGLVKGGAEIKILGAGRMKRKLSVEAHAFSNSAREAIEKAGGTVKVLGEAKVPSPRRPHGPAKAQPTESAPPKNE